MPWDNAALGRWVQEYLRQYTADTFRRASLTAADEYQLLVTQLNGLNAAGLLVAPSFPNPPASDVMLFLGDYGYPDLAAIVDDEDGLGKWATWPIDPVTGI